MTPMTDAASLGPSSKQNMSDSQELGDSSDEERPAEPCATQALGDESDEDEEPHRLLWVSAGAPAGEAACLPDGQGRDVLVLGRAPTREGGNVSVLPLVDPEPPEAGFLVSTEQAEIVNSGGDLTLNCLGKTFNFVNGIPLHANSKKCNASERLYHGDTIRLGGGRDGTSLGGYDRFIFHVDAPALGTRPVAAASDSPAATAAAPCGAEGLPRAAATAAAARPS